MSEWQFLEELVDPAPDDVDEFYEMSSFFVSIRFPSRIFPLPRIAPS